MTGEEERLYARAEMLDETGELGQAVAEVLAGAQGAGVDPRAVISLTAALQTLDPGASPGYSAGSQKDRQDGTGYGSDGEFLEAVSEAEEEVRERLREMQQFQEQLATALESAQTALQAAYAMPGKDECDGCHGIKQAAIAAALRRISLCEGAADILGSLAPRLRAALGCLRQVPQDLGEAYELVYEFIRQGRKLPAYARWMEGEGPRA